MSPLSIHAGVVSGQIALLAMCLGLGILHAEPVPEGLAPRGPSFALPANPVIETWMNEVSADSLAAHVTRLVGFGTRHTASDTTSSTTGIGAARNWLRERFEAFGDGSAEARFFDYQATVCAVFGPHRNVMLTKRGMVTPERNVFVMGHLDSRTNILCDATSPAPGANDDAGGVACLMELARILSDESFESTFVLIGTTGEEQGLFGSTQQAAAALAQGTRIDAVLNNDIIGNITGCADPSCPGGQPDMTDSTSVRLFSSPPDVSASRQLSRAQKLQQLRHLPDFTVDLIPLADRPGRGGDHLPYAARGFAASRFTEAFEYGDGTGDSGWQHNGFDLIENVNFEYLARNTQLTLACLANLLLAPESPNPPELEILGNGSLRVTWDSVVSAPDVAGYRVAFRLPGEIFYVDIRDAGLDPGPEQIEEFAGLPQNEVLLVSVSAYDADFNESIFCAEQSTTVVVGVDDVEFGGRCGPRRRSRRFLVSDRRSPGSGPGAAVPRASGGGEGGRPCVRRSGARRADPPRRGAGAGRVDDAVLERTHRCGAGRRPRGVLGEADPRRPRGGHGEDRPGGIGGVPVHAHIDRDRLGYGGGGGVAGGGAHPRPRRRRRRCPPPRARGGRRLRA